MPQKTPFGCVDVMFSFCLSMLSSVSCSQKKCQVGSVAETWSAVGSTIVPYHS